MASKWTEKTVEDFSPLFPFLSYSSFSSFGATSSSNRDLTVLSVLSVLLPLPIGILQFFLFFRCYFLFQSGSKKETGRRKGNKNSISFHLLSLHFLLGEKTETRNDIKIGGNEERTKGSGTWVRKIDTFERNYIKSHEKGYENKEKALKREKKRIEKYRIEEREGMSLEGREKQDTQDDMGWNWDLHCTNCAGSNKLHFGSKGKIDSKTAEEQRRELERERERKKEMRERRGREVVQRNWFHVFSFLFFCSFVQESFTSVSLDPSLRKGNLLFPYSSSSFWRGRSKREREMRKRKKDVE